MASSSGNTNGFQVCVKTLTGREFWVGPCHSEMTISQLKELIGPEIHYPADAVRLIFFGKRLEDHRTLQHYRIDVSERKIVHCVVRRIESDDGSAQRRSLLFSNTSGATLSTPSKSLSFCFFDSSNTNVLALSPRTLCRGLYQSDTPFDKTFELKVLQLMNARYGPDGNYFGGEFELIEDIGIRKDILDHQTRKVSQYIHEIHGIKDLQCTRAALLSHTATDQEYSRWLYTNERGELTSLHTDSSEITVNACISSSNFQGSDICFQTFANSDQSSAESQREFLDTSNVLNSSNIVHVRQRPGQALWHRGDMPHSVAPLVAGTRFNLLMWFSH